MTEVGIFYEDDEPAEKIVRAFERGDKFTTEDVRQPGEDHLE